MCVAQMSTRPVGDDRQGKRIGPTDETDETDAWAGRIHRACAAIGRHRTGATRGTEPEASIRTEHAKPRAFENRGHSRRRPRRSTKQWHAPACPSTKASAHSGIESGAPYQPGCTPARPSPRI